MQKYISIWVLILLVAAEVLIAEEIKKNKKGIKHDKDKANKTDALAPKNKKLVLTEENMENLEENKKNKIKADNPLKKDRTKLDSPHKKPNRKNKVKKHEEKVHKKKAHKKYDEAEDEEPFEVPEERSTDVSQPSMDTENTQSNSEQSNLSIPDQSAQQTNPNQPNQQASQPNNNYNQGSLNNNQQNPHAPTPMQHTQPNQQMHPNHQMQMNQPTNQQMQMGQQTQPNQQMNQQTQPNQQMNHQMQPNQQMMQPQNQQNMMGGNMAQCSQMMSQCNPPYNSMPQSGNCGLSCIPNVNNHFSNCMNMLSSCGGGQSQVQTSPMTPPSMCNNLLGLCQQAATNVMNNNYMQQCASLMGQCAPQAFSSNCGAGMMPTAQSCSPILYGCQSSQNYNFMGDDTWTPPQSQTQLSSMLGGCLDYMEGSCSSPVSPSKIVNCQNLMDYCRNMQPSSGSQQIAQQCASLVGNCYPSSNTGGGSSSCVPALSQPQCQSLLSNCMPGQFGGGSTGGNAASANIDQCIGLMSQCYPLIQGPQIQGNISPNAQQDCSALLQYCNCLNSNCAQQQNPLPNVSASDCAALMGTCNSAAAHMTGIQGMPAGCAPYYMHCKKSCIAGCPRKCCGSSRSNISKHPVN